MSLAIFPPRIFTIKNQMNRLLILVLSLSYVNIYAQRQVRGFLEIRSQISDIEQYLRYKSGNPILSLLIALVFIFVMKYLISLAETPCYIKS